MEKITRRVLTTMDGVQADIGAYLKPKPVANDIGAWFTTWKCGRYISKKLVTEGVYNITATDEEYRFKAHAPVVFYPGAKKPDKK